MHQIIEIVLTNAYPVARRKSGHNEQGIALITAIFVVALASIAAAALLASTEIAVRRMENLQDSEAAWWYAQGLEAWVPLLLQREQKAQQSPEDSLDQPWAQPLAYLPFDRGGVSGRLEDLEGRFNLNNLATNNAGDRRFYMQQLEHLVESLPGVDPFSTGDLAPAVRDWLDPDSQLAGPGGAETQDYLSMDPAYRAANRPMVSASELLAVKGMTPQLYDALRPYVWALPEVGTKINVNTAPAPVLLSLAGSGPVTGLSEFLKQRVRQPLHSAQDIGKLGFVPAGLGVTRYLSVRTDYFLLRARIHVGSADLALYSVIYRPTSGDPQVIARTTGTE